MAKKTEGESQKTESGFQLDGSALELVANRFKALSEPTRLSLLARILDSEKTVTELVKVTGLSQPNVSKHLSLLSEAGVVSRRREGLHVHYIVADDSVTALIQSAHDALAKQLSAKSRLFK